MLKKSGLGRSIWNTLLILMFAYLMLVITRPVYAYVLQGPHILDLMIEKLGKARGLMVSQNLQFYQVGRQEEPVELNETLGYVFPEFFRADIQAIQSHRIYIQSRGETFILTDGKIETDTETRFDLYKDILLFRSRKLLEKRLNRFGVDVSISSLGRFEDQLAYVVGAKYPDESVPQIWVDKQTFLPLRWIVTRTVDTKKKDALEVRYLQWQKRSNTYYPMQIAFYQGDLLVRSIQVQDIRVDPTFPDAFFDISHLKSIQQSTPSEKSDPNKLEELKDVQKTIENFEKIFE